MKLETFSYLPPLTQEEIAKQVQYLIDNGLIPAIEYTTTIVPTDHYWTMWDLPMFNTRDPKEVLEAVAACKSAHPDAYVKLIGYDNVKQGQVVSFVVARPN